MSPLTSTARTAARVDPLSEKIGPPNSGPKSGKDTKVGARGRQRIVVNAREAEEDWGR